MFYNYLKTLEIGGVRQFELFDFGEVYLSTQSSAFHHCRPKELLHDLSKYKSWEIAFLNKQGRLSHPADIPALKYTCFREVIEPLWGRDEVGPYFPTESIQLLFSRLCKVFGKPKNVTKRVAEASTTSALQYKLEKHRLARGEGPVKLNTRSLKGLEPL